MAKDKIRMLLQGAAIVRFAKTYLESFKKDKKFVLVTVFIESNGIATCYTMYQVKENVR